MTFCGEESTRETSAPMATSRASGLERCVLFVGAAILVYQLFLPPIVGMADSGGFARVMNSFGIGHHPAVPPPPYAWVVQRMTVLPENVWGAQFVTSESILVALSLALHGVVSKDGLFDIRYMGATCGALFVLLLAGFLAWTRGLGPLERWSLAFGTVLLFTDVGYVAYFNSFYSESASLLFFLSSILAVLALSRRPEQLGLLLLAYCASAALFAMAKPQNAVSGLAMAAFARALAPLRDRKGWKASCAAVGGVVACVSVASYVLVPQHVRGPAQHIAVFREILANSPDPVADLADLGLAQNLSRYAGTNPFRTRTTDDPNYEDEFLSKFTPVGLLRFYVMHPGRLHAVLERTTQDAIAERPDIGNFVEGFGLRAGARSLAFDLGSRLHAAVGPASLIGLAGFFGLYAGTVLALRRRSESTSARVVCDLLILVVIVGATQFLTVGIMQGPRSSPRHLLLLKVVFDVACLGILFGAATLASRWPRVARPLLACLTLGVAAAAAASGCRRDTPVAHLRFDGVEVASLPGDGPTERPTFVDFADAATVGETALVGVYGDEGRRWRWMGRFAALRLRRPAGADKLVLDFIVPRVFASRGQELTIAVGTGRPFEDCCFGPGEHRLVVALDHRSPTTTDVATDILILPDLSYVPAQVDGSTDSRVLSLQLLRAEFQ
jgi:hypothetical protein